MLRHKYGAKRTIINGESFPSKLEASVISYHWMLEKQGQIKDFTRKATVRFDSIGLSYKPDGKYHHVALNETRWIEAKGMETDRWKMIKKIWKHIGPGKLEVYKANHRGIYLAETIEPLTSQSK